MILLKQNHQEVYQESKLILAGIESQEKELEQIINLESEIKNLDSKIQSLLQETSKAKIIEIVTQAEFEKHIRVHPELEKLYKDRYNQSNALSDEKLSKMTPELTKEN